MAVPCAPSGDKQVQLRRGTTAENDAFTGADGELSFDTDQNRLRVHDGVTPGGFPIALLSDIIPGSSPPFVDTTNIIMGSADNTKLLRFEVDGFTAGTTRTLTPQNASYIIAGVDISNSFLVTQFFDGDGGIEIGSMTISDPLDAGTLTIGNGSVSIPGGDLSLSGVINFADNVRQTFNPGATVAGLNVGSFAGDPSTPINGDIWYNSTSNELTARINGVNVDLGAGSAPPFVDSTALVMGSDDNTKLLRFEVDGFTTGVTRVLTPQDASYIIAGTNIVNVFSVNQSFDANAGIAIGSMLLTDPGSAGQLIIDNGSVSIPGGLLVGPAGETILAADGAASFAAGVSFFSNTGQLFVGGDTIIVPDGSAYFGVGQVLQIDTDGSINLNSNIDLNADGSAAFGAAGVLTISAAGLIGFPDDVRQTFNPGATVAGLNVGSIAGDPSTPINGDLWYDSTANELTARINGVNVALGTAGYSMQFFTFGTLALADSTTYYFTMTGDAAATAITYANARVAIPKTGILRRFDLLVRISGVLGSGETVSHFIRINDTTDVGQIDCAYNATAQNVSNSSISQAVTAGDFVAVKIVTPAWVTNPITVRLVASIYIE